MKTVLASLTVATGVLAVVAVKQHQQVGALTEANAALIQQLAQAAGPAASDTKAGKLSDELLTELLQLRAEAAKRLKESPRNQAAQVAQLQSRLAEQAAQLEATQAEAEFRKQVLQRVNAMKMLALAARLYAADNSDQIPTTLEMMRQYLDGNGRLPGGISPSEFEFFPQPRPVTESEPHLILFREKMPLVAPSGDEIRVYALMDGSVQQVNADRVVEFEREGTATGPAPAGEAPEDR